MLSEGYTQLPLPSFRLTETGPEYWENVVPGELIGEPAISVVNEILRLNPEINKFVLLSVPPPGHPTEEEAVEALMDEWSYDFSSGETHGVTRYGAMKYAMVEREIIRSGCFDWKDFPTLFDSSMNRYSLAEFFEWGENDPNRKSNKKKSNVQQEPRAHIVTILSKVELIDGQTAHIPMLDYRCPISPANQAAIEEALAHPPNGAAKQSGWLLNSGGSYHFLGSSLLNVEEWANFHRQKRTDSLIDPYFLYACEKQGYGSIRISSRRETKFWRRVNDPLRGLEVLYPIKRISPARPLPKVVAYIP